MPEKNILVNVQKTTDPFNKYNLLDNFLFYMAICFIKSGCLLF